MGLENINVLDRWIFPDWDAAVQHYEMRVAFYFLKIGTDAMSLSNCRLTLLNELLGDDRMRVAPLPSPQLTSCMSVIECLLEEELTLITQK